ncbi:DNA polymerase delta subunit 3 [Holothuria leucospilota]|uniref:DNA polymerase delta subunit 3 n=1 Tax=Holothuria leucospilota TaxID=206669 RepID=A0A9Q1H2Q9_HOLLE|nr:DNA polymerase delta subunit 3 [Holothuria leucospilota]
MEAIVPVTDRKKFRNMAGDLALENIEEFLFDEDRVVSYKWLSKTLSMHVNQAKSKLEEFAENWREKPGSKPITLTFFVSGIQETTSGSELTRVAIVKEEDLENVKKNLKKTLCEHIYSIQKSALKDTAVLYQTDFDETKQHLSECNKYSAIKCKSVQTRSSDSLVPVVSSVPNGRASPAEETKEKVGSSKATTVPEKKKGLAAFVKQHKPQDKNETKQTKVSSCLVVYLLHKGQPDLSSSPGQ